jgi:hypothetical protein
VRRLASDLSRGGLALAVFLLALAVLRWRPVYADPPWNVRALPLAAAVVLLAIPAAMVGRERRPRPLRPVVLAALGVAVALAVVVGLRGPGGLAAEAADQRGPLGTLPQGPIDVLGGDLRFLAPGRRVTLRWDGVLRAPQTGTYRLWAVGRGDAKVALDGRVVLTGGGDVLRAGADALIGRGPHRLEVQLDRVGPGPRLRLGWTQPRDGGGSGGRDEMIPPRLLGPETHRALWRITDLLAIVLAALIAALVLIVPWDRPRRPPLPRPVTGGEIGWSVFGHALLALIMSWPLVLDLAGSGVTDRPDGRLNAWILAWDAHALLHDPGRLFQAPIFHPLPDTLAFSENLLVPAILAAPATLLSGPVLGYNLVLLLSVVVSGLGVQFLVRRASGDRLAAFVAGAFFAVGSHRWIRMAHLHAEVTLFLPLAVLALDRFWQRRTLGRALLVGFFLALQALSSIYLGAITALVLAVALALAAGAGLRAREVFCLAVGIALAGLLVAPVARPYFRMRAFQGMEWSLHDVAIYATTLESYAASGTRLYGGLTQRHLDPERVQDTLFPGVTVLALGLCGLASAPPRFRAVALLASAAAVVFSLGPETALYRALHESLVLVRGVRALSRFSLVPVLSLCVLSGFALAGRWRLSLAALVLFLVESGNIPIRYAPAPQPSAAARWLAGKEGAVADLPLGARDTEVMLDGVSHFRPLVNGDSGFMPRPYTRAMELLEPPPTEEAARLLRAVGVRHVVMRTDPGWREVARFGEERIAEVPPGDAARPVPADATPRPTLWTAEGIVVETGTSSAVAGVTFEVSEAAWIAQPRVEVSADGKAWTPLAATASLAEATLSLMRDPPHGRGAVGFAPTRGRYLRLDPRLPARSGALNVLAATP